MARPHAASFDEEMLGTAATPMDGYLSSSWPSAAPPTRQRPDPPRPPSRKPSDADWEVPPMALLPVAPFSPRKRSASGSAGSTVASRDGATMDEQPCCDTDEDEDFEEGVFVLDGMSDSPDDDAHSFDLAFVETDGTGDVLFRDSSLEVGATHDIFCLESAEKYSSSPEAGSPLHFTRPRSNTMSPKLGASPTLLSALEHVALEAGSGGRQRAATAM